MARKNAKIRLDAFSTVHRHGGTERCALVKLTRKSGWHNPIGRICEVPGGYTHSSMTSHHSMHGPKKTKAAAVRALVKSWRSWVNTATYDID
jgi:hypothetical protein